MATPRPSFASLGLAPLILRLVLGATFLWAGLGKWMGTMSVQGEDAALLANLDIIPRSAPVPPAPSAVPAKPLPAPGATPAPAAVPGSLLILAQSSSAAPTKSVPVTAGPPLATAADFPEPVSCRAMWGISLAVHRAAHPPIDAATSKPALAIWPPIVGDGLWPKVFAVAVFLAELCGGIALLIGLFTRLAAISVAGVMLGAIWLTQVGPAIQSGKTLLGFLPVHDIWDARVWMPLGWQLSLLASALALACLGCGVLAIDRAIAGYRAVPERFQRPAPNPTPPGAPRGAPKQP
jgi:uncharacterized membrane protein YphA (DoxX/SURF4 family)